MTYAGSYGIGFRAQWLFVLHDAGALYSAIEAATSVSTFVEYFRYPLKLKLYIYIYIYIYIYTYVYISIYTHAVISLLSNLMNYRCIIGAIVL